MKSQYELYLSYATDTCADLARSLILIDTDRIRCLSLDHFPLIFPASII